VGDSGSPHHQKSSFERPSTSRRLPHKGAFYLFLFLFYHLASIVEATMHYGAYHEVGGAALRTVHLTIVFCLGDLFDSHAWRGGWWGNGFRWCCLMTVALMLYYSLSRLSKLPTSTLSVFTTFCPISDQSLPRKIHIIPL
jgi:hypothetical protein